MKKQICYCIWLILAILIILPSFSNAQERRETETEGILDSTGTYLYSVNEDGTATILCYQQDEEKVIIPSSLDGHPVTVIGKEAFWGKRSVAVIGMPETVTEIGIRAFSATGIEEITIPDSVLTIRASAFFDCRNLKRLTIPQNVKEIEGSIVQGTIVSCSNKLTEIRVDSRNTVYSSVDGVLYNKAVTELLAVPGGKDLTDFIFPDSVVHIGDDAFLGNDSLEELVIPVQITKLGEGAFSYCRNLKKVVIGKGVTSVDASAFTACGDLSEVVIIGRVESIGEYAFMDCYDLSQINIPDSVTEIGRWAFYNCGSLKSIAIPKSVTLIEDRAFGYSEDCEERISGVRIIGYVNTAAQRYAKEYNVIFQNAETDEVIRYDFISVPTEKIKTLTAGKKKIKLTYKTVEEATYRIAVKKIGSTTWKKYDVSKTSAVIKGLKSGKQYKVKVRALRKIDGKCYYGNWSSVKKITVR